MERQRPKIISLPKQPGLPDWLQNKLRDWENSMPDGIKSRDDILIMYKYVVLRFLIESEKGQIDTDIIRHHLSQIDTEIATDLSEHPALFDSACTAIYHLVNIKVPSLAIVKELNLPANLRLRAVLQTALDRFESLVPDGPLRYEADVENATKFLILHCLLESEQGRINTDDIYNSLESSQHELWEILEKRPHIFPRACREITEMCDDKLD